MTLDVIGEASYGGVTSRWIFLKGAENDCVQVASKMALARRIVDHGTWRMRLLFTKDCKQFFESWVSMRKAMRSASRKDFVEKDTERVNIGRFRNGLASGLLG